MSESKNQKCSGTPNQQKNMANWFYYNEKGEKIGVTGGQLKGLAKNGRITPETVIETEEGKSVPAGKIQGLTFLSAVQFTPSPSEPNTPIEAAEGMAKNLDTQDFEQLRKDFERLQKQQELQQVVQNIPTPKSPPVVGNPFVDATSSRDKSTDSMHLTDQTIPPLTPVPVAEGSRKIRLITIVGILILLAASGIGWAMIGNAKKLNRIVETGINRDVISDLPLEISKVVITWIGRSDSSASGKFFIKMKTTEALYESIDSKYGLQKLGIIDLYEAEFNIAIGKLQNLPVSEQNNLRNAMPEDPSRIRFYDILVQKGGEVTLTGNVELIKHSGNDWNVKRFLVDPFSCGDKFIIGSKLQDEKAYKLDDANTKAAVNAIIQHRKDFVKKVDSMIADWEQQQRAALQKLKENLEKFCKPGMTYAGSYQSGQARGNVRVVFETINPAKDRITGTITFSLAGLKDVIRPFEIAVNTGEVTVTGTINNSRVPNNGNEFARVYGPATIQGARDFYNLIQNDRQVVVQFTNSMEFSVGNSKIPLNLSEVKEVEDSVVDVESIVPLAKIFRDEYGFSCRYPRDWQVEEQPEVLQELQEQPEFHIMVVGEFENGFAPNMNIILKPCAADLLQIPQSDYQADLEAVVRNVQFKDFGIKSIANKECLFSHCQYTMQKNLHCEALQVLFLHKNKTFIVTFGDSQANFNKNRPVFDSIISSFQFE